MSLSEALEKIELKADTKFPIIITFGGLKYLLVKTAAGKLCLNRYPG